MNRPDLEFRQFEHLAKTRRSRSDAFQSGFSQLFADGDICQHGARKRMGKFCNIVGVRHDVIFDTLNDPDIAFPESDCMMWVRMISS
jgi:hypothetical protein